MPFIESEQNRKVQSTELAGWHQIAYLIMNSQTFWMKQMYLFAIQKWTDTH